MIKSAQIPDETPASTHVAVVIVGYRNAGDIAACLTALETSDHSDFEVVVCENGGPAACETLRATIPTMLPGGQLVSIIMAPDNLGFAGGVNLGMAAAASADAWWVLNPDTQPAPDALSACVARLAVGDCEAVGCTLYRPDRTVQSHGGLWRPWLARAVALGIGSPLRAAVVAADVEARQNYLNGAAMLIGRRFRDAVGPMREDYFLYCEEVEWCLRGRSRGMRLGYAPAAQVLHVQGSTTGAGDLVNRAPRLPVYLNERNRILMTRDCFPRRLPIASLAALALLGMRYARRGAWRQFGYGLAGWWAGLREERGRPSWS